MGVCLSVQIKALSLNLNPVYSRSVGTSLLCTELWKPLANGKFPSLKALLTEHAARFLTELFSLGSFG